MRMNFERRKIGLERKIKLLSELLAKEKKTRAGMKESELFILFWIKSFCFCSNHVFSFGY